MDVSQSSNIDALSAWYCNLSSLNVSGLLHLKILKISDNPIANLNLTGLTALEEAVLSSGGLVNFVALNLPNLNSLRLPFNTDMVSCDIGGLPALATLYVWSFNFTSINLLGLPSLQWLNLRSNHITSVDLSQAPMLSTFYCENNQLTTLDLFQNPNMQSTHCENNSLTWISIKNGNQEDLYPGQNPNLGYICADDSEIQGLMQNAAAFQLTNCEFNTYCSFSPGGTFCTVHGNSILDVNNNGCDGADPLYPKMKFALSNGTLNGAFIANNTGSDAIPLIAGTHTITPILEEPSYFTVSPASTVVNFPAQTSPLQQNFCIAGNGSHPDMDIVLLPMSLAQPGFDATYKVMLRNKGNIAQSGTATITFDDSVADFVSSNPSVTNQFLNTLVFAFTGLSLSETREIFFTLNLNTPLETPPLNLQEILHFNATASSALNDSTPLDNTFSLSQITRRSYDPNVRTFLEGATISPQMVGQSVHYMIRFVNNGTANAQNIVVKDIIDKTKFDISSLIPFDGSHSFETRISAGNKVEFIFENINLPFGDANNDGYVAFKIKTKPTLVADISFSNTASIHFDYNFPVITNTASTTLAALSKKDFDFSIYIAISPNPAKNVLNLRSNNGIEISSVSIYSTIGQLLITIPNAQQTTSIDVSHLQTGTYFLTVVSNKGTTSTKFLKQ